MDFIATTTAKGYERLAIDIRQYVGDYKPCDWREPIRGVIPVPQVTRKNAKDMLEAHQKGKLGSCLESAYYDSPCVVEAFMSFFETHDIEPYLEQVE